MSKKRGSQGDWERGGEYMDEFVSDPDAERMNTLPPGQVQRAPLRPLSIVAPNAAAAEQGAAIGSPTIPGTNFTQGQQQAGTPNYLDPNYRPAPLRNEGVRYNLKNTGFLGGDTVQVSHTAAGDPIYMPQGSVPLFELQSNLDEVRNNKRQLADWWGKQGSDQFAGQAAPQYEREYQQWAVGEQNRFVQQWADAYFDGDRSKAMRHLYEDADAQRQYQAFIRDLKASGVANKYYVGRAQEYTDAVNEDKAYMDPELYKEAEYMLSGAADFGVGSDSAAVRADHANNFDRLISRDALFNSKYQPQLTNALQLVEQSSGIQRDPATGRMVFTQEGLKTWEGYKTQVAKEMQGMGLGTYSQNMDYLNSRLPDQVAIEQRVLPVGRSGGGSGNGGSGGGVTTMFTPKIIERSSASGSTGYIIEFSGETGGKRTTVPSADISAMRRGATHSYRVLPERIEMTSDGQLALIGRVASRPNEKKVAEAEAKGFDIMKAHAHIVDGTATEEEKERYTRFVDLPEMQFTEEEMKPWVKQSGQTIEGLKRILNEYATQSGKKPITSTPTKAATSTTKADAPAAKAKSEAVKKANAELENVGWK